MSETAMSCGKCGAPAREGARFCRTCGSRLQSRAAIAASTDPHSPQQRQRLRRRLRTIGITVLVLVVICGGVSLIQTQFYGPEQAAEAVFAAIESKDGHRLGQIAPECLTESTICTEYGLSKGYEQPTNWKVLGISYMAGQDSTRRPDKNRAFVDISYQLNGVTHRDRMQLHRQVGVGLFRVWTVTVLPGAYLYPVTRHVKTAVLANAEVKTVQGAPGDPDSIGDAVMAVPGNYTLHAGKNPLLNTPTKQVTIDGDTEDRVEVVVPVAVKPSVVKEIDRQVRDRLDECAEATTMDPQPVADPSDERPRCPFKRDEDKSITQNIRWSIEAYPKLKLSVTDEGPVKITTVKAGTAVVTYEWSEDVLEPRDWHGERQSVPIHITGVAEISEEDPDKVVWRDH